MKTWWWILRGGNSCPDSLGIGAGTVKCPVQFGIGKWGTHLCLSSRVLFTDEDGITGGDEIHLKLGNHSRCCGQ